jgi:hypothetical protein
MVSRFVVTDRQLPIKARVQCCWIRTTALCFSVDSSGSVPRLWRSETQAGGLYCLSPHLAPAIGYNNWGKRWP